MKWLVVMAACQQSMAPSPSTQSSAPRRARAISSSRLETAGYGLGSAVTAFRSVANRWSWSCRSSSESTSFRRLFGISYRSANV